jgi:hypothetical protein
VFLSAKVFIDPGPTNLLLELNNMYGTLQDPLPILLQNVDSSNTVYIGGPGVTSSTGYPLAPGGSIPLSLYGSDIPIAISIAGDPAIVILAGRQ